ncbi:MAG: glycogen synthase [bacterium]
MMSKQVHPESSHDSASSSKPLLFEVAWEVCQQLGGIYTVIRSKVPSIVEQWGSRYCLIGPYNPQTSQTEFEEVQPTGMFRDVIQMLTEQGIEAHYGHWLVTGRPRVILVNPESVQSQLGWIKYLLWEHHNIAIPDNDDLVSKVVSFGYVVEQCFRAIAKAQSTKRPIIAHFHEWMGGSAIPEIRRSNIPVSIVFTTHATLLGRYLAMNDPWFYDHVPFVDWVADARRFNIEAQVRLERAAAHGSHVFSTVSDITGFECEHLLGRKPDVLVPNGLNLERFVALHEFQNLHRIYKEKINEFVVAHFFPSYSFDLDRTLYFFTSGRFEYRNKGFDLTIEALARLNHRMKQAGTNKTIVFFVITKQPIRSINAEALRRRAMMQEMQDDCRAISNQISERLFVSASQGKFPDMDELVDDYWRLRLRRLMHVWKSKSMPTIVTHDLVDDHSDEVLNQLRTCALFNQPDNPVKVVYHPDFVTTNDPLFGMDYDQFVRGCHLGIFPSAYAPWGYAPLECAALGLPSVTSNLSGFGTYLEQNIANHEKDGLHVLNRRYSSFDTSANALTDHLFEFMQLDRRERINQRNRVQIASEHFDWHNLGRYYTQAYDLVLQKTGAA